MFEISRIFWTAVDTKHFIFAADHVLETALDPNTDGVPKDLFSKCVGICILSVVEAGFVFSGNVGSGILLKKKEDGSLLINKKMKR